MYSGCGRHVLEEGYSGRRVRLKGLVVYSMRREDKRRGEEVVHWILLVVFSVNIRLKRQVLHFGVCFCPT